MIRLGRSLLAAVPAALALALPASAGAACAQSPLEDLVRKVPVVVTAQAQPGPTATNGLGLLSPATFRVVAYDQGSGPQDLKVHTALTNGSSGLSGLSGMSDGVNPMAGQTWRLWGTIGADGVLETNVCLGSTLMVNGQAPALTAGKRRAGLRAASFAGVPRRGALPTLTVPRGAKALLQVPAREANFAVSKALARSLVTVHQVRGDTTTTLAPSWSAKDGLLVARLAPPSSGTATVVVITRAASYAVRLRAA